MANDNKGSSLGAFLLGAVVGAAIIALSQTEKGKQVVEVVKKEGLKTAKDILDKLKELEVAAEKDVEEQITEAIDESPEQATSADSDSEGPIEQVSEAVADAKDEVAKQIAELQNRGRTIGRKFFKRH
ncbi:MAG TPA: YtxH domain-containing protein [Patescibacteria group bacterium]